ncbi:porin [Bacteroidales bacterium OttesenSCG-928-B11]|nr:porin [Bacteroidales bacterium OttesenSCG-928-C03]MDL2311798.1 porin [Bacteroidales bacterium OttesenSCG-928-B11]MDL2326197.1 porin [Bacteroidales bacterium OttesenSCG-928-A14]
MRKILFFLLQIMSCLPYVYAQEATPIDSSKRAIGALIVQTGEKKTWSVYNPERGYFQKAFTDVGDPRFMIANEDETFKFGIGGFVNVIGLFDFNGMIELSDFVTSQIPVPMGSEKGQFRLGAESSRFNIKVVGKPKKGTVITYIEADFHGANNLLLLRHAYISYFGFTIGQTWSTFMDLEAGPPTIDFEGPNTQISIRQPMIRYSHDLTEKLSFSVALEMNTPLVYDYNSIDIEHQRFPNLPLNFKYKDKFGHLQLAAIARPMNYYDDTLSYKSITELGYGIALSGKFNLPKKFYIYFQGVYGKGIAQYIQDLSFSNLDLVLDPDRVGRLKTMPTYGAYLAFQKDWLDNLYSAIIYGYTALTGPHAHEASHLFAHTHYAAVNLFWDPIPYGTIGIEYLFGRRVNQSGKSANANRVDFMFRYRF